MTDAALRALIILPALTTLDLRDCPNVTADGVQALRSTTAAPSLHITSRHGWIALHSAVSAHTISSDCVYRRGSSSRCRPRSASTAAVSRRAVVPAAAARCLVAVGSSLHWSCAAFPQGVAPATWTHGKGGTLQSPN